jgi:hypothetical protein
MMTHIQRCFRHNISVGLSLFSSSIQYPFVRVYISQTGLSFIQSLASSRSLKIIHLEDWRGDGRVPLDEP